MRSQTVVACGRPARGFGSSAGYARCRTSCCEAVLLTYMSIQDEIQNRLQENRLFRLERALPSDPVGRDMLKLVVGPWNSPDMQGRCGRLRADLESFIGGDTLTICLRPFEAGVAYMRLLKPPSDGIFDIRSRDPNPALRVFGGFARRDVFVALTWAPRSKPLSWSSKQPLEGRNSREWRDAVLECKTAWKNLFGSYQPVTGDEIENYATSAVPV